MTLSESFALAAQHHQSGRLAEAEAIYRHILAVDPRYADALHLLGVIAYQVGRGDVAVEMILQAIALMPDVPAYHSNLGVTFRALGRLPEAISAFQKALQLDPDEPETFYNLGNALTNQVQLDQAVAAYRRAIQLNPRYVAAFINLGAALRDHGRFEEALAELRMAIQLEPANAEAHNNLGNVLSDQGYLDEAIDAHRRAVELKPQEARTHSNLLLDLHYVPGFDPRAIFLEHCRWAEVHARPLEKGIPAHGNDRNPHRRLRVGYVSPDFREHSVMFFMEGLLALQDRTQFEVYCYADMAREDHVTGRLRGNAVQWRRIAGSRDEAVAELIRQDGIDILVDLAGHTAGNRLEVFARKPAPVQVTWLGYPATTGMKAMDYRLTDAYADPPGTTERWHSEQLVRLPDSAWCYRPVGDAPPVSAAPIERTGCVTFGCFNAQQKINGPLLALWAEILKRAPGSRLLLKNRSLGNASVQARMRAVLEKSGIAAERVELAGPIAGTVFHLAAYGRVDIALDTFPYHGTTTTCEALWMGVPVVTLAGKTHVSRVGVSLLNNVGLPEMIAGSAEAYVEIATSLAGNAVRLAEWRMTLRERMRGSVLMNAPHFARNIEAAYRQMWRAWCAPPCSSPAS